MDKNMDVMINYQDVMEVLNSKVLYLLLIL